MSRGDLALFGWLCFACGITFMLGPYYEGWAGIPNWVLAPPFWIGTFVFWLLLRRDLQRSAA